MILKKSDLLSPHITLYFKGDSIHSSIFSGILTIIAYIAIFSFSIYYTVGYIYRYNPTIYFYTKYVEDVGTFPLNSSSLFHFIALGDTASNENQEIDFQSIRIIGLDFSIENYYTNNNLTNFDHWLYGPCNNNDIQNLSDIVIKDFPEKSACIWQFFNSEEQKYYNTTDKKFKWPALIHGCSHDKASNYGIIMEKCRNDSLKTNCKSKSEIDLYFEHIFGILYFIDNYAEVLDFEHPYVKYLYKLTNGFYPNSFTINHLNFNPALITSNDGIFVNHRTLDHSYQFTQNEKATLNNSNNTNILLSFYFWMQNFQQNYERKYKKFQNVLSNLGGISSFIIIAKAINLCVNKYIILLDTEELVLKADEHNYKQQKIYCRPTILKRASEVLNPPKIKYNNQKSNNIDKKQQSSVFQILLKDLNVYNNNNNNKDAKSEPFKNLNFKNNNEMNISKYFKKKKTNNYILPINIYKRNDSNNNVSNDNKNENTDKQMISDSKSMSESIKDSNELETEKKQVKYKPILKQNFTWCNYFYFLLTCKSGNPKISYYENFRTQIISEENIIQNHLNIFKLMKVCKIDNIDPFKVKNLNNIIC